MDAPWLRIYEDYVIVQLHVQPGARKTEVVGQHGEALKLRVTAAAFEGKANAYLIEFMASVLCVPRSAVTLLNGKAARRKVVRVEAAPLEAIERLRKLADA